MRRKKRIVIVDDHPMVCQGFRLTLSAEPDLDVCGAAATESDALELAKTCRPDLMLVDVSLKRGHGIELVKQLAARYPHVKVLVVSGFSDTIYGERALRAGAKGYLNKQESPEKLVEAVRTVLDGGTFASEELSRCLVAQALGARAEGKDPTEALSNRELEVFRLIGKGLSSGSIAEQLFLSRHTVDTHRENIKRKLGAKNAWDLNAKAVHWLLVHG